MKSERPGCLKILGPLAKYFAVKDKPAEPHTRTVDTSTGISVELFDDMPDGYAEAVARAFAEGRTVAGSFDEDGNLVEHEDENPS